MSTPLVSICLPNLNTLPFLHERIDTILRQTYQNWEMIVTDGFSDDGSWEFFQRLSKKDRRMSIAQAPREGPYPAWNNCINRSHGKYVYIATSDDTMAPECLEKLVGALERHPECDLAHCQLRTIDSEGRLKQNRWSRHSIFVLSSGELFTKAHIRRAPFDGLLHLLGETVYHSITQLLIRQSLFTKIGLFESKWGSEGDFNWGMRAGLVANTIHVPDTWGGYRIHAEQATARVNFGSLEYLQKIEEMIEDALSRSKDLVAARVNLERIPSWWKDAKEMRMFFIEQARRRNEFGRKVFTLERAMGGSWIARTHLFSRVFGWPGFPYIKPVKIEKWLSKIGIAPVLLPV
jgi:glycosyltransferase involved in cell wall biosynthesis